MWYVERSYIVRHLRGLVAETLCEGCWVVRVKVGWMLVVASKPVDLI